MPRSILLAFVSLWVALPAVALGEIKLEIGPDTTVIDGPINPDGTINYLAYLNQKLSEGVTLENNFAVDVAMTMGEGSWPSEAFREKVMKGLGIEIPGEGPFFVRFETFLTESDAVAVDDPRLQQLDDARVGPWDAGQYPDVKRWLDKQNEALDRIVKSLNQKDRSYFPLITAEGEPEIVEMVLIPWLGQLSSMAKGLAARAQWKIAAGDLEGAWSDVQAIHLVANHTMREPHIVSWMVGVSFHRTAIGVMDDVMASDRLNARFVKRVVARTRSLSTLPDITVQLDTEGRLGSLDALLHCWKGRGEQFEMSEKTYQVLAQDEFDPNVTLREINRLIDRLIEAAGIPDPLLRIQTLERMDDELGELYSQPVQRLIGVGELKVADSMRAHMPEAGLYSVAGTHLFMGQTFGRPAPVVRILVATQMHLQLQPVALAIGGYHAEHGEYPPGLDTLVPAYLDSLPTDFATGGLPVYRVEDGVAIVYSLGVNLKDDGGLDDFDEGDIVFRIER